MDDIGYVDVQYPQDTGDYTDYVLNTGVFARDSAEKATVKEKAGMISSVDGYQIISKLGEGGFGVTYLAEKDGRYYVVKRLEKDDAIVEFDRLQDIRLSCRKHLNCPVALFEDDDFAYIVTEYLPGKTVDYYIKHPELVTQKFIDDFAEQMLEALTTIHGLRIAHRDIKPANIIYDDVTNTFYLIDFGIACNETCTGCTGTPYFMSPLYLSSCDSQMSWDVLEKSDLFALGVNLFLVSEGVYPWAQDNGRYIWTSPNDFVKSSPDVRKLIVNLFKGRKSAEQLLKDWRARNAGIKRLTKNLF